MIAGPKALLCAEHVTRHGPCVASQDRAGVRTSFCPSAGEDLRPREMSALGLCHTQQLPDLHCELAAKLSSALGSVLSITHLISSHIKEDQLVEPKRNEATVSSGSVVSTMGCPTQQMDTC